MARRRKPFTGPRQHGPHGVTLVMRAMKRPRRPEYVHEHAPAVKVVGPEYVHEHAPAVKVVGGYWAKPRGLKPYVNPDADRSLSGKARRRARRTAR